MKTRSNTGTLVHGQEREREGKKKGKGVVMGWKEDIRHYRRRYIYA